MSSSKLLLLDLHIDFSGGRSGGLVFPSLQNLPQFIVIHIVKGFGIVNKAEMDVFLELFCFFDDPVDVGNLISGSYAFSKSSLNMWKFLFQLSSGHRTGKGQFSFQSQRKAMPKNAQTTAQLHSSHTLVK